MLNQVRSR